MGSIIDSPEVREAVLPLSVEFYHAATELGWIDEEVELLDGIPVKKMGKSPEHEYLVSLLLRLLEGCLPEGCFVVKERPLTCARSEPEPDVMLVAGDERSFRRQHPTTAELVIEVAVNTLDRDRGKASIYAEAGVKEYWLVAPGEGSVTVYREPGADGYQTVDRVTAPDAVASDVVVGFQVSLPALFA